MMPCVDEVEGLPISPSQISTKSPKDYPEETTAHIVELLSGLQKLEALSTTTGTVSSINYGFYLHELLSITPDSPGLLLNKTIRPFVIECAQFLQDVGNNLHNSEITNQLFRSDGAYYEQMKNVAVFIAEAIGYPLFLDSTTRDLVLGVIELHQTALLQLLLPFCDLPQVYTVIDELAVCNKKSKLFVILATCLLEEFKTHVMYKCTGEGRSQNELNSVELWCSLLRSLIRNLPPSQDPTPLLSVLGKTLQPHFPFFLELAASKDIQIATLFLPLITDIFTTFEPASSQLPKSTFVDFNERVKSFIPFLSHVPSLEGLVLAHYLMQMLCSAALHPDTLESLAESGIFNCCVELCFVHFHNTLASSTLRLCDQLMAQNNEKLTYDIQKFGVEKIAKKVHKKTGNWFALELLRIILQGNFSRLSSSEASKVEKWAKKIPIMPDEPDALKILNLELAIKQLEIASATQKNKPHQQELPHQKQSRMYIPPHARDYKRKYSTFSRDTVIQPRRQFCWVAIPLAKQPPIESNTREDSNRPPNKNENKFTNNSDTKKYGTNKLPEKSYSSSYYKNKDNHSKNTYTSNYYNNSHRNYNSYPNSNSNNKNNNSSYTDNSTEESSEKKYRELDQKPQTKKPNTGYKNENNNTNNNKQQKIQTDATSDSFEIDEPEGYSKKKKNGK